MKTAMSSLLVALLVAASVPVSAEVRGQGVNQRQFNQQQRIQQGVRQGDLTRVESRQLQGQARDIRREEHAFRSDGRFTPAERQQVNRDLNQLSRNIHNERHDGDRRVARNDYNAGGHSGWDQGRHYGWDRGSHNGWDRGQHYGGQGSTRQFDRRYDYAQFDQRQRIEQGVRSGALTHQEANRLMAEQRALESQERRYLSDGYLSRAERADMVQDLNAANRNIYNEAHDAQTRR